VKLLGRGYRWHPSHGFEAKPYQKTEEDARKAKWGMRSLGAKYVSPKEWRKKQKKE